VLKIVAVGFMVACMTAGASAGDGKVLFDGKDLEAWQAHGPGWVVEDGALRLKDPKQGGYLWSKERFGDFVLSLEFNTKGNSGIFIRTDRTGDPVQTGIEVQVLRPEEKPGKHSVGALYDLVAPSKINTRNDDWNRAVITARGPAISVEINGEKVTEMDLDRWATPGQNPDGSKNKFKAALKDFKRDGHIGLQAHGDEVAYRNIVVKPLPAGP
jgi:hypothetical protein